MNPNNLADYDLNGLSWASLMFARVFDDLTETPPKNSEDEKRREAAQLHIPKGYVFIIERQKHDPLYKFAGGSYDEQLDKTPLDTAVREFKEEAGIKVSKKRVQFVERWLASNGRHYKCLFSCDLFEYELQHMSNRADGNEGEEPVVFTPARLRELIAAHGVLQDHVDALYRNALLLDLPSTALSEMPVFL